jgi:hypothetical protein
MSGIKETLEVLDAFEVLLDSVEKIYEDGRVDLTELLRLAVDELPSIKTALDGFGQVREELMDLDALEAKSLLLKTFDLLLRAYEVSKEIHT